MVAVFTGSGLGLFDTSLGLTGGSLSGGAGRDRQGVNAATGNLVLQGLDELLSYRGLTTGALRTYNSAGTAGAGADAWLGVEAKLTLSGPASQPGGTITHVAADGSATVYAWNATRDCYETTAGDGAHDTIRYSEADLQWIREDGNSLRREYYEARPATAEFRLAQVRETRHDQADPARVIYLYDAVVTDRIVEIRTVRNGDVDAGNDALVFGYEGITGRLLSVSTRENGVLRQQVNYGYDGLGRLSWVEHDLTPTLNTDDTWDALVAANNNHRLYRNSYTYDGNTLRIASVTGSDGQTTNYTWDAGGRIKTVTRPGGESFAFTYNAGSTDIVDALGRKWTYAFDAAAGNRLTAVYGPLRDNLRDVTTYAYDAATGDVTQVETMRDGVLLARQQYRYDERGNVAWEWDALGNAINRTWNDYNQLLVHRAYTGVDADGPGTAFAPTGALRTQYVYAEDGRRLRFVIGPTGQLTEMRYAGASTPGAQGQLVETRTYATAYTGAADLELIEPWLVDQYAGSTLTALTYDALGRLAGKLEYADVAADGSGLQNDGTRWTDYTYDAQGLLLKQVVRHGAAHSPGATAASEHTDFVYDGMGRLLDVIRHDGGGVYVRGTTNVDTLNLGESANSAADHATEVARTRYLDSAMQVVTVSDAGVTRTELRDGAGRLVSVADAATGVSTRTSTYRYDAAGQLVATIDYAGAETFHFYDERGHRVATVAPNGQFTELEVDALGRTVRTLRYAKPVAAATLATWIGDDGTLAIPTLASARPTDWSELFADAVMTSLDAAHLDGTYAAGFRIDAGRLAVQRAEYATSVNPRLLTTAMPPLSTGVQFSAEITTTTLANTYLLFSLHNGAAGDAYRRVGAFISNGRLYRNEQVNGVSTNTLIGDLEANTTYVVEVYAGEGGIEYRFFAKGQDRDNGFSFRADVAAAEWGQVRLQINGQMGPGLSSDVIYVDNLRYRQVRQSTRDYDLAGRLVSESDGSATTTYAYDGAHRLLSTTRRAPGEADRVQRNVWDDAGRLTATLDAEGFLSEHLYDASGRLLRTVRWGTAVAEAQRAAGTPAQMRPASHATDQWTRWFHDSRGRVIGELDAEGYVTETFYDDSDNLVSVRRHAKKLAPGGSKSLPQLQADLAAAPVDIFQETRRGYDHLGRLATELNHEGTLTKFHYDHASRLVRTEAAANVQGEVRNGVQLFDAFGNLVGELDPMMAMNGANPRLTDTMTFAQKLAQIDAVGYRHHYDPMGRRTETVDPDGNKTWYFHDASGRLTHTLRGQFQGAVRNGVAEVSEIRYNAFGDVVETLAYTGKLAIGGTQLRADAQAAIAAIPYVAATDLRRTFAYDSRGNVIQRSDGFGNATTMRYDGFGQLVATTTPTTAPGAAASTSTSTFAYDRRGQLRERIDAAGQSMQRSTKQVVDAFGRVVKTTDGRSLDTAFAYDRLGRLLTTSRGAYTGIVGAQRDEVAGSTWDAFGRVLTQTNGVGQVTTFAWNDVARTVTMTTPDGLVTTTERNVHGETFKVTAPGGGTTTYAYDAAGRTTRVTDANGDYTIHEYNNERGLLVATVAGNGAGNRVEYTYDSAGRVLTRREDAGTGKLNLVTTWTYDGQGRAVTETDPATQVTQTTFDREGRVVTVARDPSGLNLRTQFEYDAAGRQTRVTEGFGTTAARSVAYAYDALGQRTSETRDPGGLNLTTTYIYDGNGNVTARVDANGVGHAYAYDQMNRLVYAMDTLHGPGDPTPTVAVTRHWYDEAGRLVGTRRYATSLELTAAQTAELVSASGGAMIAALDGLTNALRNDATDAVEFSVYDAGGKLRYGIVQTGALKALVRETRYDVRGNANFDIAWANEVALTAANQALFLMVGENTLAGANSRMVAAAALVASGQTLMRQAYRVHDAAGRVRYAVRMNHAGAGEVVEYQYDNEGRVVAEIRHARTVTFNAAADATATGNQLAAATADEVLVTRHAYDRVGRLRYSVDDLGFATANTWDAAGRLSEVRRYTAAIAPSTWTEAAITTALTGKANVRVALHAYDKADRLTKTTDALGGFDTFTYDAAGNRLTHVDKLNKTTTFTYDKAGRLKSVKDALNKTESYDYDGLGNRTKLTDKLGKISTFAYDSRGNLLSATDPLLHVESFTYDVLGRRTSYTDKTRTATWTYAYDQLDRMIEEKSPSVTVFRFTTTSGTAMAPVTAPLVTKIEYDAFGNVTARVENAGADVSEQRRTEYAYDRLGRQVKTTFPRAWQIHVTTLVLTDALAASTIDVVYDALGRAIQQKDASGAWSYKVYDQLGRVVHDIDAEGFVTSYEYDALGRQTKLIRRAAALAATTLPGRLTGAAIADTQWTSAIAALATTGNRAVVTTYDALDRKDSVQTADADITYWTSTGAQASGRPTTTFEYDAMGRLVRERVFIEKIGTVESWAETYHYYDAVGQRTHTVDAERYLTRWTYDANGRETERREYANRVAAPAIGTVPTAPAAGTAATGYDRIVGSTWDDAGRRTGETVQRYYQTAAQADVVGNVGKTFEYDNEGRVIAVIEGGLRTEHAYDVFGNLVSVLEDDRLVLKANWRDLLKAAGNNLDTATLYEAVNPYTRMDYDAFGNVVRTYRTGRGIDTTTWAIPDSPDHQLSYSRYDRQGRAVVTIDAEGRTTYAQFDASDRATKTWYDLSSGVAGLSRITDNYTYDRLGRQTLHGTIRWNAATGDVYDAGEAVRYNAFGEIVVKGAALADLDVAAKAIVYVYDAAGNLTGTDADGVATNAEGTLREYRYNLAGQQVAERRHPATTDVTRMELDKLGRALKVVLPGFDAVGTLATVVRVYDRWGNVLTETDPRGGVTDRTWNERNQLVSQRAPTVSVLSETAVTTSTRPETRWYYDAGGRLIAVKDANGKLDRNEYDNAGQLVRSFDALDKATRYAYDTLGRQLVKEDALRYQTTQKFDRLDRVVEVGDFLVAAGNTRVEKFRERYVLNQNGDRITITNGENEVQRFDYDGRGKLLYRQAATGAATRFAYDLAGNKIGETLAAGTALAATQTWAYDVYGRLVDHVDLGGHDYGYTFDAAGRLVGETTTAMEVNRTAANVAVYASLNRTTTYYANGQVKRIQYSATEYTDYEYDANGNRTREYTYKAAVGEAPGVNVDTRSTFDSHNRLATVTTDDNSRPVGSRRVLTVSYSYDAVGNRRRATLSNGYGPTPSSQDAWYTYDGENRVLISEGKWDGSQITFADLSMTLFRSPTNVHTYDDVGRVSSSTTQTFDYMAGGNVAIVDTFTHNQRGERIMSVSVTQNGYWEMPAVGRSQYDDAGRLVASVEYFGIYEYATYYVGSTPKLVPLDGVVKKAVQYVYDDDGRLLDQITWGRHGATTNPPSGQNARGDTWAIALGQAPAAIHYAWAPDNNATGLVRLEEVTYRKTDGTSAYDAAGRLSTYRFIRHAPAWAVGVKPTTLDLAAYTHTFTMTYVARDGFLEGKTSGSSSNTTFKPTTTDNRYDAANRHHFIEDHTVIKDAPDLHTRRQFVFNGEGQVLLRKHEYEIDNDWRQGKAENIDDEGMLYNKWYDTISWEQWDAMGESGREGWYDKLDNTRATYVNGQQIVSVNEGGLDLKAFDNLTGFRSSQTGRGRIVVQEGDTLQTLAQRAYGSAGLWYVIADANGLSDSVQLAAGTSLALPEVRTSSNDAATFKPYDPSEITGPTTPNLPYIPKPETNNCAMIAIIIVVIVVTIVTWGAMTGPAASAGAGAAGAAGGAGATAGAGAAAGAGAGAGAAGAGAAAAGAGAAGVAGTGLTLGQLGAAFVAGAAGNAAGQVVGMALGVQKGFSFKQMVAGGLKNMVTMGIAGGLGATGGLTMANAGAYALSGALGSVAGYAIDRGLGIQTTFSWKSVAASAVGSVVGGAVANGVAKVPGLAQGTFAGDFAGKFAGGVVSGHVNKALGLQDKVDYVSIAADAFGTAAGSAIARDMAVTRRYNALERELDSKLAAYREALAESGMSQQEIDELAPKNTDEYLARMREYVPVEERGQVLIGPLKTVRLVSPGSGDASGWGGGGGQGSFDVGSGPAVGAGAADAGWGEPIDPLQMAEFLLRPDQKIAFAAGAVTGIIGSVSDDLRSMGEAGLWLLEAAKDNFLVNAYEVFDAPVPLVVNEAEYDAAKARLNEKGQTILGIANNIGDIITSIPGAYIDDLKDDSRRMSRDFRNDEFFDSGVAGGMLLYKTVGMVLGGTAAVKGAVAVGRSAMTAIRGLSTAAKRVVRQIDAPTPHRAPRVPDEGSNSRRADAPDNDRVDSPAAAAAAATPRVIRTYRNGNRLVEYDGRTYNVPKDMDLDAIPKSDRVGDLLQDATSDAAKSWNPQRHLTANERTAISDARAADKPWLANLLEKQAKGRWVEARVRADARLDSANIDWNRTGVDAIDLDNGRRYDILSATRSNVDTHARRMHDQLFRMIGF